MQNPPSKVRDSLQILPKAFYMIRHGQSADNALGLISGSGSDPDLTELGRKQARQAAEIFQSLNPPPVRIVASSLKRTHQTAEHIIGHTDYIRDADLNERHLGDLDGKISEVEQKKMKTLPGEETSAEHLKRVVSSLNKHLAEKELSLFVCHGGTVRRVLESLGLKNIVNVANARIYKFEPTEFGWTVSEISSIT